MSTATLRNSSGCGAAPTRGDEILQTHVEGWSLQRLACSSVPSCVLPHTNCVGNRRYRLRSLSTRLSGRQDVSVRTRPVHWSTACSALSRLHGRPGDDVTRMGGEGLSGVCGSDQESA